MALETSEKVELFIRSLAKLSAKQIPDGTNRELIAAREKMPEPCHYKYPGYRVPLYDEVPLSFWRQDFPITSVARIATFDRVLTKDANGTTFWAWQNTEDKCVYV